MVCLLQAPKNKLLLFILGGGAGHQQSKFSVDLAHGLLILEEGRGASKIQLFCRPLTRFTSSWGGAGDQKSNFSVDLSHGLLILGGGVGHHKSHFSVDLSHGLLIIGRARGTKNPAFL